MILYTRLCTDRYKGLIPMSLEYFRVGDKVISLRKIHETLEKVFTLRSRGSSQQEVAAQLKLDRSLISRLEAMGELRKGKRVAVVGFPLKNKDEIRRAAEERGVDFVWVMDDKERWDLVQGKSALDFFNDVMERITRLQAFDVVIVIGSPRWLKLADALLDGEVVFIELGDSPIKQDCTLSLQRFTDVLQMVLE